ncbi:unnamed protein product, partial [Hymenolepis diminuta]
LSFSSGVLRFKRPSDFAPQNLTSALTPQTSSKSSSVLSLNLENSSNNHQNLTKSHPDLPESINEEKDEEDSPLGSGEINRAMSELEDVNPGTWSGRLPPTLPGLLSSSTGHFYCTTAKQRSSFDPHLQADKVANPMHNNDGDDKSIKSECLPVKSFDRSAKRLGIPSILYSSDSNLLPPDTWSNSLPNRSFREFPKSSIVEPPSSLAQLRARADGREESSTEGIYGPLGFIKLPYEHPRLHNDHHNVKSPHSVIGCVNLRHSADAASSEGEVCHLRDELELARQKVTTLTSQLESNACLVSNFEQSLASMAQRLQSLTVSAAEKDSELRELRRIIDAMAQERSTSSSVLHDQNSAKPPFSPSSLNNLTSSNATTPVANITDNGEVEEETSNSLPPGT